MDLILILAVVFTICLAVEAFSNDAVGLKVARIVKFGCGLVFVATLLL